MVGSSKFHSSLRIIKHQTRNESPFQIVYGRPPPSIPSYVVGNSEISASDDLLTTREAVLDLLKKNLTKAQAHMKSVADNKRREVQFEVDSWVYVKLQPYRQISLSGVKYNKLHKRYYGPFRVVARIGPVAYKLELPSNSKVRDVLPLFSVETICWLHPSEPSKHPHFVRFLTVQN